MLKNFFALIKKKPVLYRLENEKAQMCYRITYNMRTFNKESIMSINREFILPDNIINDMNNGWDLESIEIRDYHFKSISINSDRRNK